MAKTSITARDKAKAMVNAQRKKEKRTKKIIIASIFSAVIVLLGLTTFLIINDSKKVAEDVDLTTAEQITPALADENGAFYTSNDGIKTEPASDTRATRVDLFFDPQCPGCGTIERGIGDRLAELVENEEIDLYLTPVSFLDRATTDRYSSRAANAVVTVAENSPEHLLSFVHAIYEEDFQPKENGGSSNVPDSKLADAAKELGVPNEVADSFKNHSYFDWIAESTEKQKARTDLFSTGFSTPSLFLDAKIVNGKANGFTRVEFTQEDVLKTFNDSFASLKKDK